MIKNLFQKKILLTVIFLCTLATAGIFVGSWSLYTVNADAEGYEELKVFSEALSIVRKNYVDEYVRLIEQVKVPIILFYLTNNFWTI